MKSLFVQGRQGALSAAGVKAYRQNGLLVARDFLSPAETDALTAAVVAAATARGVHVFPGIDADVAGEVKFDGRLQPKPSVRWDKLNASADIPPAVAAAEAEAGSGRAVEWQRRNIHLKYKGQRGVDRAYRKLARHRARYGEYKVAPRLLSEEDEMAGRVDPVKMAAAQRAYTEGQLQKDLEAYQRSGRLEREIRRENHIDDCFAFIGAWARCWAGLTATDEALRRVVLGPTVGQRIGEAAAALSGEVVLRMFADSAYESYPFMNATPMGFAAAGSNYASPTTLAAVVGLADGTGAGHATAQRFVVMPGSQGVTLGLTAQGADTTRFQLSSVFDFGRVLRLTPELRGLEAVELPPLAPGSVLFLSNFTVAGTAPTLSGSALSPHRPPASRTVSNPYQLTLQLMPDRCAFDGERNSWASRDSHGPLFKYSKGQLLTDDAAFPVLHRSLDIE